MIVIQSGFLISNKLLMNERKSFQRYSIFKNQLFNDNNGQEQKGQQVLKNGVVLHQNQHIRASSHQRNSRTKIKIFSQPKILQSKQRREEELNDTVRKDANNKGQRRRSRIFSVQSRNTKVQQRPYKVNDAIRTETQNRQSNQGQAIKIKLIKTFNFDTKKDVYVRQQKRREQFDIMTPHEFAKLLRQSKTQKNKVKGNIIKTQY